MSKSYNNTIPIFDTPKRLKKLINRIRTDSTPLEDPKDPDSCAVFELYRLFATPEQLAHLADRYRAGGMGYGEAKSHLYDSAMEYFGEPFDRRRDLEQRPDDVEDILQTGAAVARAKAQEVVDRAKNACGLQRRPS